MQQHFECVGLTDVVATIQRVVEAGGEIDFNTVGGTGSAYHDYGFEVYDGTDTTRFDVKGRNELVETLAEVVGNGATIIQSSLSAIGGRTQYVWFEAEMPEQEESPEEAVKKLVLEEGFVEEPAQEVDYDSLDASPAAIDLMKAHKIDPKNVEPTGKGGKYVKGDVVKYLDSLK